MVKGQIDLILFKILLMKETKIIRYFEILEVMKLEAIYTSKTLLKL